MALNDYLDWEEYEKRINELDEQMFKNTVMNENIKNLDSQYGVNVVKKKPLFSLF